MDGPARPASSPALDAALELERVKSEIGRLRAAYPELDWTFVQRAGSDPAPPTWPPEMPTRARRRSPAAQVAPRRVGANPAASPPNKMLPGHQHRPVRARPPLMRAPECRQPGFRPLSHNRTGASFSLGRLINLSADVDPNQADADVPGPGAYDTMGYGMAAQPRGPSFTIKGKLHLSSNVDPLVVDDSLPGPGQYDVCKY